MKIYQVDAFTDRIFSGNPAGICVLASKADDSWMQNVAKEMNLSETAFLLEQDNGFSLRWFTPAKEVDLCGHATLASAHIMWESGILQPGEEARFFTRSGLLTASGKDGFIELNFPIEEDRETSAPPGLLEGLKTGVKYIGKNRMDYIIEVGSEDIVRGLKPDMELLKKINTRGVIVTSRSDSPVYDFVSRFFAPVYGIPEDPVTGSAHCCLGPFWKKRLDKDEMTAYQASERGGTLKVRVEGDRVFIGGQAVTFFKADLNQMS